MNWLRIGLHGIGVQGFLHYRFIRWAESHTPGQANRNVCGRCRLGGYAYPTALGSNDPPGDAHEAKAACRHRRAPSLSLPRYLTGLPPPWVISARFKRSLYASRRWGSMNWSAWGKISRSEERRVGKER